jgi:phosphate transport system substrate-binding protein
MRCLLLTGVFVAATASFTASVAARDYLWIVGSGTVHPYSAAVAERAARAASGPAPVVEQTGTTLAFAYLCGGPGAGHPNAASVTRRMTRREFDTCVNNGVSEIVEIPIGLDILVVVKSKAAPHMRLTLAQLFLALAANIPGGQGSLIANPHRMWSDIDRSLPHTRIDVRVLPPTSGTRDALQELFLRNGAERLPDLVSTMAMDGSLRKRLQTMRSDQPFLVVHESQDVIARELVANPNAIGIFAFRFLKAYGSTLRAVAIEGTEPTEENAYAGRYPGTRKLYIYVRKDRVDATPGLDKLGAEYLSSAALGPGGYLLQRGFIPLPAEDMVKAISLAKAMPLLRREFLPD